MSISSPVTIMDNIYAEKRKITCETPVNMLGVEYSSLKF